VPARIVERRAPAGPPCRATAIRYSVVAATGLK
jgi:hypothetical protein